MFRIEREKIILQRMQDGSAVKPSELAALTGASSVTIRRDLCLLEQRGLIFRSHGCAQMKKADDADL
ncbi:MAG: DeoR family transcriptional regulator, partial [Clostridia bacterium]